MSEEIWERNVLQILSTLQTDTNRLTNDVIYLKSELTKLREERDLLKWKLENTVR